MLSGFSQLILSCMDSLDRGERVIGRTRRTLRHECVEDPQHVGPRDVANIALSPRDDEDCSQYALGLSCRRWPIVPLAVLRYEGIDRRIEPVGAWRNRLYLFGIHAQLDAAKHLRRPLPGVRQRQRRISAERHPSRLVSEPIDEHEGLRAGRRRPNAEARQFGIPDFNPIRAIGDELANGKIGQCLPDHLLLHLVLLSPVYG